MAFTDQKLHNLKSNLLKLVQSGQFKKAEKLYPRIKKQKIQDADLWRLFAGIHSKRENLSELVYCCKKILKINPDDFQTAFNLGATLQNMNHIDEAIKQYEDCITINPDYPNTYANCAHLYYLAGNPEKSVTYFHKALENLDSHELRMQYAQALAASGDYENALQQLKYVYENNTENNKALFLIAQCYYETRNYNESEKYYLMFLEVDTKNIKAINNLGRLYDETGRHEKAIKKYIEAIEIDGSIATIYLNLGKVYIKTRNIPEAKKAFLCSIKLDPQHPESYFNLGKLYGEINDTDKAKEYLTKALDMDIPGHMEKAGEFILAVKYFLSNIDDPDTFNEDKKAFVADLFDGYADKFDEHLVEGLQYKTPQIINDLLTSHVTKIDNATLDLGCGTGLCCKYLKERSAHITGVDLSAKMIDKARELGCYDELIVGEITEVVNNANEMLDLIVAADVFVYIGSLEDIFLACSSKMNKNGYFIFSTEHLTGEQEDFRLFDSGRYKHSNIYLNQLLSNNNFELVEHNFCTLRKENGRNVEGCVTILRKL